MCKRMFQLDLTVMDHFISSGVTGKKHEGAHAKVNKLTGERNNKVSKTVVNTRSAHYRVKGYSCTYKQVFPEQALL